MRSPVIRVAEIRRMRADDRIRNRLLGLAIIDAVGTRVLVSAVESLGDSIRPGPPGDE